jgi:protease I
MGLEGKRVAILVEDDYQMHEFWYPYYRFQEAGAEVRVIGTGRAPSFTSHGYSVTPDLNAAEARVDDFDA